VLGVAADSSAAFWSAGFISCPLLTKHTPLRQLIR
jgi:hypothetical protein